MYRELGLHANRLEIVKLFLQARWILELHVWRVNGDDSIGMATESKPLASEIEFFVTFTSIDLEISREVIRAKSCCNVPLATCLQYFSAVYKRYCRLYLRNHLESILFQAEFSFFLGEVGVYLGNIGHPVNFWHAKAINQICIAFPCENAVYIRVEQPGLKPVGPRSNHSGRLQMCFFSNEGESFGDQVTGLWLLMRWDTVLHVGHEQCRSDRDTLLEHAKLVAWHVQARSNH